MEVVVATEHHFERTPDGAVWTATAVGYEVWVRYLQAFDSVRVLVRVRDVPSPGATWRRADGPGVRFAAIPDYLGPERYLLRRAAILRAIRATISPGQAYVLTCGNVGRLLRAQLATGVPYAVEVVGDPVNTFASGALRHPLRAVFRWAATRVQRRLCAEAAAALYVTERSLQESYPCRGHMAGVSDVELDAAAFRAPRTFERSGGAVKLVHVGTLAQLVKAQDVLIDAVARCVRAGIPLELTFVGDGARRLELEARARSLGIAESVRFTGLLPSGRAVREELDRADLFVLPSRAEGLPRAMVEAMARGLPCLGSRVGGIPELLAPSDLVEPGNVADLATAIASVVRDPARLSHMAARNAERALAFRREVLDAKRAEFYRHVRVLTEASLAGRTRRSDMTGRESAATLEPSRAGARG